MPSSARPDRADPTAPGVDREWLLTNGVGGFAMGTTAGVNTRRYHGLLVAALSPPVRRVVVLHSVAERVTVGGTEIELWSQQFGDPPETHPRDASPPQRCVVDPAARQITWRLAAGGAAIDRTVTLEAGRNAVRVEYALVGASAPCRLVAFPLTPLRNFHHLFRGRHDAPTATISADGRRLEIARPSLRLDLAIDAGAWRPGATWWWNHAYVHERDRGLDWHEDVFCGAAWTVDLHPGGPPAVLAASLAGDRDAGPPADHRRPPSGTADETRRRLHAAADQFIVTRRSRHDDRGGDGLSIIAGYPWFADWGRDAMISIPGLLMERRRWDDARSVLLTFARHRRRGLVPNCFDDETGAPHYNSVDAGLWFVSAVGTLHRAAPSELTRELADACADVVAWYRRGTDQGIGMDDDGLVTAGDPSTQLTWMDARRDGIAFTPRHGKAVEVNALWHRALHVAAGLLDGGAARRDLVALADRCAASFRERFWWPQRRCCHDRLEPVEGGWRPDGAIRPNQLFAVSLEPSPLTAEQQRGVVEIVTERLLTPVGLRTLDPGDPAYRGRFEGDLRRRDAAYHQGTVWPWLIGPYAEALRRVRGDGDGTRAELRRLVAPLLSSLDDGCAGQIAEVYDGDPPHRPSGCPAQAWSVAEVLRVLAMAEGAAERRRPPETMIDGVTR